ncbi:GNAT family N-acetyltransferase [Bradyrhizobium sp. Arg62]|uniref:acyl-homoserine-lactone synthase n=1 Tax=Bradyrhizobium brasilense TaxID=1419277 RepID=UPI001E56E706|nr:acyl-homoserine-lactone synthase [Bradyrhizobium brasilense]MCC8943939.1 GNAT family N-acetyltransferase [Bradyrhizobium brasilense]
MQVVVLRHHQFGHHLDLLAAMFRLRRRVFKDRLDWTVSVSGEFEIDVYDALNPTYLLITTETRDVVASVRLLPTTGPTMLTDTFSSLLAGRPAPRSEQILESSRFCVDTARAPEATEGGLNRTTFLLFAAMIEGMRAARADAIATVTDVRMERILRRAGWPLERIAPAQRIGQTMALAGFLRNSDAALAAMYRHAAVEGPVLRDEPLPLAAA